MEVVSMANLERIHQAAALRNTLRAQRRDELKGIRGLSNQFDEERR
jgi:hypothetical protein